MIQDIFPYRLDTAYRDTVPAPDDRFFSFQGEDVLLREGEDGCRSLPSFRDLQYPAEEMPRQAVFLFRVDKEPVFLLDGAAPGCRGLRYFPVCGNTVYPCIAPVVMVAVINGDKLLMTKYADHSLPQWVLISGFVETGETLEEAAEREVFEETGIRIRDLQYFGSQSWGFSDSVIAGYTARLDGPDEIRLDRKELAEAEWHLRSRLPDELTDISIAHEMIESLRL